jgi:hypothetical protein
LIFLSNQTESKGERRNRIKTQEPLEEESLKTYNVLQELNPIQKTEKFYIYKYSTKKKKEKKEK